MTPLEIEIANTAEFAKRQYGDRQSVYGRSLLQHCTAVSKIAESIAQKLYQDLRADFSHADTSESIATIVQGAMLHDVINVRCAFEEVAEQTTVQIAALVADISRDFRLVETKRDMEFRGRLSQSPVSTQIVAIADVLCTTKEVIHMLREQGNSAVPRARKLLAQLDGDLMAIHAANLYYVLRLYSHAAKNLMRDASQLIKDCRAEVRRVRLAAQLTANVNAKVAARLSTQITEDKASDKKKGQKNAKKRVARKDS